MNIKSVLICSILIINCKAGFAQFNTVLAKPEPVRILPSIANDKNRAEELEEKEEIINDGLIDQRNEIINKRNYISLPIDSVVINSDFGYRKDPFTGLLRKHQGIDLKANNDYVYSVMPGKVLKTGNNKLLGKFVQVQHGKFETIYGHLYKILVTKEQSLDAGQSIGISGNTGRSTGEHLHFGVKYLHKSIDPTLFLDTIKQMIADSKSELSKAITKK